MELSSTSGAAKRRKRRLVVERTEKSNKKITTFFITNHLQPEDIVSENQPKQENSTGDVSDCNLSTPSNDVAKDLVNQSSAQECAVESLSQNEATARDENFLPPQNVNTNLDEEGPGPLTLCKPSDLNSNSDDDTIDTLMKMEYPTDKAHFEKINLSDKIKTFIIKSEPCQPKGPFPKDVKNRSFSCSYYKTVASAGQSLPVKWLNYSKRKDYAYCMPCWLFSSSSGNKNGWAAGISDWQGLSKKIKVHSNSQQHILACLTYHQWKVSETVNDCMHSERKSVSAFWSQVLERLFDITLMLAKNSLAFRGKKEHGSNYDGNFLSLVQLLAKYDTVMAQVISIPKGHIRYLSHDVQNQIISCMSGNLKADILKKINKAQFYSVIIDTTQDLSKRDQMSFVIRYTNLIEDKEDMEDEECERIKLKIEESFLGFFHVSDADAHGISTLIVEKIEELGLNINKCRGQGYDGAAVMSGVYTGVQKRLQEIEELAIYIHCAAHNLNLVINDAVGGVRDVSNYFTHLQSLYIFFGHSINRWDLLSSLTGESDITLKKLNPTRWASRHESILALKLRYLDVIKALAQISLESKKPDEVSEAKRLMKQMDSFKFVILTVLLSKIFTQLNISSKILQSTEIDLQKVAGVLKRSKDELKKIRNDYPLIKKEAEDLAAKWQVNPVFPQTRQTKVKRFYDELSEDHRFFDAENEFRITVFYTLLDIVNGQIEKRFKALEDVVENFNVIFPKVLLKLTDDEIMEKGEKLQKKYKKDIGPSFCLELISLRDGLKTEISKLKTVSELASLLLKFDIISSSYPEVLTALLLFLTLPVSVASAERTFSVLKRIKSYLRCSMGQERLSDLGLIAINHEAASELDKKSLIKCFASLKSRKKDFL